jgi:aminoglycoside phosphotransferase (APT) family kinase protein
MPHEEIVPARLADESALPSSDRLLRGIQATLQKISTIVGDEQSRAELSIIDAMLSELASRDDTKFYREFYRAERLLLKEGLALLRTDAAARIEAELATELPPDIDADASYGAIARRIKRVMRHLAALVRTAHEDSSPAIKDFLQRVTAQENEFHVHRVQVAQARQNLGGHAQAPLTLERLQNYLVQRFPGRPGLRVTSFKQLVGGFQKITVLFETIDDSGRTESLVMRMEKNDKFVDLDASDIRKEYDIVKFLHEAGVPVAEPFWLEEDATKLGDRFFVSQRVPGENFGTAVSAKGITDDMARSYIEGIAQIHKIPVSDAMRRLAIGRWAEFGNQDEHAKASMAYWRYQTWMKASNPSPLTERLYNWLCDNIPHGDIPNCLIHCDYGPHNTLVHNGKLSAILDWESARIGDPAEDISWFLQSSGGQVDYGKALGWYEEFTGHRISEYRIRYYDVLGCLKIMVSNNSAEAMYEAHEEASVAWLNLSLRFGVYGTSTVESKIKAAEAARGR